MTGVVAVVQARMTSTRLPGKVLMDIEGVPMLARQLRRLRLANQLDHVVVATTTNSADDDVARVAADEGVAVFRGDEINVLGRCIGAAREVEASVVVRVTGDCPLLAPEIVDRVCAALERTCDYASNVIHRTFPRGLDVETMHIDVLERVDRMAISPAAREHVTWFLRSEAPELFRVSSVEDREDNSDLQWSVDDQPDIERARRLYRELGLSERLLPYRDMIRLVRSRPELTL
jgi:spore coat polysaccharide biosynthesis protein SpsF